MEEREQGIELEPGQIFTRPADKYSLIKSQYHSDIHYKGDKYASSSYIKAMRRGSWFGGSNSSKIGQEIHEMFENILNGHQHHIEEQVAQKGSKKYVKQLADLEELLPKGRFSLCTKSNYSKMMERQHQIKLWLKPRPELQGGMTEYLIFESLHPDGRQFLGPQEERLAAWLEAGGVNLVKCAIDYVTCVGARGNVIVDWKTTSQDNVRSIYWDTFNLDYIFSIMYYRMCLQLTSIACVPESYLVFFPTGGVGPITLEIDTRSDAVAQYMDKVTSVPLTQHRQQFNRLYAGSQHQFVLDGERLTFKESDYTNDLDEFDL